MARPRNETAADRERERLVGEFLAARWRCDVHKTPDLYKVDYFITSGNNEVKALVEIKCRNKSYPTLCISAMKIMDGVSYGEFIRKPFFLVVAWPVDGQQVVMYLDCTRQIIDQCKVINWGRRDRGQESQGDVEPSFEIPMNLFKQAGVMEMEAA